MYVIISNVNRVVARQGCSQEFSFTESRLKGKGTSDAGGLSVYIPLEVDTMHHSNLLNSYDNTMGYYVYS